MVVAYIGSGTSPPQVTLARIPYGANAPSSTTRITNDLDGVGNDVAIASLGNGNLLVAYRRETIEQGLGELVTLVVNGSTLAVTSGPHVISDINPSGPQRLTVVPGRGA